MSDILIADSGSTKTEWCLLEGKKRKFKQTQGLSPYFLDGPQIEDVLRNEVQPFLKNADVSEVFFYGTGCHSPANSRLMKKALSNVFTDARIQVTHDLLGTARAVCGKEKGIACILGTGSNSCYFDGKKIVTNSPGLGFILGDEGSGAYLGRKVIQYYLYKTFDEDLMELFDAKYKTDAAAILHAVYKEPLPNRYLASFTHFLAENRGHYMIENILEDGLNDFFFTHVYKYRQSWTLPVNFTGSIAYYFKDVLQELCKSYELELGTILKTPMEGLIKYHTENPT
ncbi:MAG: N-acetylglucosamine kinase [Ferruginibacter sp.]